MTIEKLNTFIAQLKQDEANTHDLRRYLNSLIQGLHSSIQLPKENAAEKLSQFISEYIGHVPKFLNVFDQAAKNNQLQALISPLTHSALNFFFQPPKQVAQHHGLEKAMHSAYLCQRLFEEINDHCISKSAEPLIPIDMTTANLIVHNIIGEPLANDLDVIAEQNCAKIRHYLADLKSQKTPSFIANDDQWNKAWLHWSESFSVGDISLRFEINSSSTLM